SCHAPRSHPGRPRRNSESAADIGGGSETTAAAVPRSASAVSPTRHPASCLMSCRGQVSAPQTSRECTRRGPQRPKRASSLNWKPERHRGTPGAGDGGGRKVS
ncbi:hypothetical protein Vretimale_6187, partial [Volvox reticuliferus]